MIHNIHPISCVTLTKTALTEILSKDEYSYAAVLVSSLGNVFILGDVEDYEILEVDEFHEQYVITDAGGTQRTILFHEELSDYGMIISTGGVAISTSGITIGDDESAEFIEFVKYETGVLGQECTTQHEQRVDDSNDEELH